MFDEDDEGADGAEEDEAAASDDDAFVVAKPQVRVVSVHFEVVCCFFKPQTAKPKLQTGNSQEFCLTRTT